MLPFLNPRRKDTSVVTQTIDSVGETNNAPDALHMAAEDIITAVHAKDAPALAEALKAAFMIMDANEQG